MGFFKDLALIKELKEKKFDLKLWHIPSSLHLDLSPYSTDLDILYRATDMIYAELSTPTDIYIFRRYVWHINRPTPDMSRLVRKANTCYVDLEIHLVSETAIQDESILQEVTQQVLNDTYNFGELTVDFASFGENAMENHLKFLKEFKRKFPKHAPFFKKRIANLKAVLEQKPVISKVQHSATIFKQRTYEELMSEPDWTLI
jgi:hypothetical protein